MKMPSRPPPCEGSKNWRKLTDELMLLRLRSEALSITIREALLCKRQISDVEKQLLKDLESTTQPEEAKKVVGE